MAAAMSTRFDPDRALHKLGEAWETELNAFKPYSCGIVSHPVIDAAVLARAAGIGAADVVRATVVVRPVVLEVMGVKEPKDGLQSKFSVYHCFAVGLIDGGAGPAQYSDARATAAEVVDLRRKVEAVLDPQMPKDACRLEIVDRQGGLRRFEVDHASGSADAPMTDAQLAAKFGLLVGPRLGQRRGERLWRWAIGLDSADSMDELYELATVREGER
jgi:2-methylcitrate dehydratase PrpD